MTWQPPPEWEDAMKRAQAMRSNNVIKPPQWPDYQFAIFRLIPSVLAELVHCAWQPLDILGCGVHPHAYAAMGLAMLIHRGDDVIDVTEKVITTQRRSGSIMNFNRMRDPEIWPRCFLWEVQ